MIRFQLILVIVMAALVAVQIPTVSAQTVAFFDDFETDEGGDGNLNNDTSTSGHIWGNSIVGIVEDEGSADQSVPVPRGPGTVPTVLVLRVPHGPAMPRNSPR